MKKTVSIIKAGQGDIPLICALADEIWRRVYCEILSPEQINYMMDMMYCPEVISEEIASGVEWYLLNCDNQTAGYLSIYHTGNVCKLDKIYIRENFRKCGVGRAGIEFVKKSAKSCGARQLILNVNKYNCAAQAAYKSYGFTHLRDEVNDIGSGFVMDDFVLSLEID